MSPVIALPQGRAIIQALFSLTLWTSASQIPRLIWARTFLWKAAQNNPRNGKVLKHDIGRVFYHLNGEEKSWYFINMCGMEFDAAVNRKVTADLEIGHLAP